LRHLHRTGLTDGQLLECFFSHADEAAMGVLVRRHGPMVWGVCRRLLRNHHDAEDDSKTGSPYPTKFISEGGQSPNANFILLKRLKDK
jgi:hypothetical protein